MVPIRLSKPNAVPKGELRRLVKGRADRAETKVAQQVRAAVDTRDGDCRLRSIGFGPCGGESEWAHLEESKRARTRGMPADVRHSTAGSCKLCTTHHRRYDAGMRAEYLSRKGADGRIAWHDGLHVYVEPVKKESR